MITGDTRGITAVKETMKYIDLTLSPTTRAVNPFDGFIREHGSVEREVLMHVDARGDGTTVLLYRLIGDCERFAASLGEHEQVHDHEVVAAHDDTFHVFIQVQTRDAGGGLIDIAHENALIIDTPLKFVDTGIRATLVGTHENLRAAMRAIPDGVAVTIRTAGDYLPGGNILSPLTDRQLEVVRTAVAEGYYEVPSRATQDDIARILDCATSTVDEHLRKAEAHVASGLVQ